MAAPVDVGNHKVVHATLFMTAAADVGSDGYLLDYCVKVLSRSDGFVFIRRKGDNKFQVVSTRPEDATKLVWQSRDYSEFVFRMRTEPEFVDLVSKYRNLFVCNLVSPSILELGNTRNWLDRFSQVQALIGTFGRESVTFSFAPVMYWIESDGVVRDNTQYLPVAIGLCVENKLQSLRVGFAQHTRKAKRACAKHGISLYDPAPANLRVWFTAVALGASIKGVRVWVCTCDGTGEWIPDPIKCCPADHKATTDHRECWDIGTPSMAWVCQNQCMNCPRGDLACNW